MDNLIPLNILIGDRSYRIKILPSDEEKVRGTLKIINAKILEFRSQFAGKDMQDYIAMVLIWYATQLQTELPNDASGKEFEEALEKIDKQLDSVVSSE
ncbi:MAG: cell division protein ZapA [Ginsengibacter sp.]